MKTLTLGSIIIRLGIILILPLVFLIPLAIFIDRLYGTSPLTILVAFAISASISALLIIRMVRK